MINSSTFKGRLYESIFWTQTQACPTDKLCPGERIIESSEKVGSVIEVFSNGQARLDLDGHFGSSTKPVHSLGKGVHCYDHICVGDRIIEPSEKVGTVIEVFDNGKAKLNLDRHPGYYIRKTSSLGKGYRCIENVCTNERVIDRSQKSGKIAELFDNGKVKVNIDRHLGYYIFSLKSLGIELNCRLRDNCLCQN